VKQNKRVVRLGSSKADLKALPKTVLAQAGYELFLVQYGLEQTDMEAHVDRWNWSAGDSCSGFFGCI
jgi:phage-related protein